MSHPFPDAKPDYVGFGLSMVPISGPVTHPTLELTPGAAGGVLHDAGAVGDPRALLVFGRTSTVGASADDETIPELGYELTTLEDSTGVNNVPDCPEGTRFDAN